MKKEYWHIVLTAGFALGVLYSAMAFLGYAFHGNSVVGWLCSIGGFASIVWSLIYYGRRAAAVKDIDGAGFSYGQAFGFSLLVLLLSGVLVGISQWVLQNVIDPAFYEELNATSVENILRLMSKIPTDEQVKLIKESQEMAKHMWPLIMGSMFNMAFLGGLVALVTSTVIKRKIRI